MTYVPDTEKNKLKHSHRWYSGQMLTAEDIRLHLPIGSFLTAQWSDGDELVEFELVGRDPVRFRNNSHTGRDEMERYVTPDMGAWDCPAGYDGDWFWHSARFVRGPEPAQTESSSAPDGRIVVEAALLLLREKFAALARLSEHYRDKIDEEALTTKAGDATQMMVIDEVLMRDAVRELNDVQLYCRRIGALVLK